jgi:hypothetical protein
MSHLLETALLQCPHCWEQIEILVDRSIEQQEYVEDCSVCCNPILITVWSPDDENEPPRLEARMEQG